MVSDTQRTRAWEEWLSAEIRAYYFAELAGILAGRQRAAHIITLIGGSAVVSALLASAPPWMTLAAGALVTIVSVYSVVAQNQKRASEATDLHYRWTTLASAYRDLWDEIEADTVADIASRLKNLDARGAEASRSACGIGLPADTRRMRRWQNIVVAQHHAQPA